MIAIGDRVEIPGEQPIIGVVREIGDVYALVVVELSVDNSPTTPFHYCPIDSLKVVKPIKFREFI